MTTSSDRNFALDADANDPLASFQQAFHKPHDDSGKSLLYFAGHSLGVMPKAAREAINGELDDWAKLGVEGHFHARNPWLPYHEFLTPAQAHLVGAKESEVVTMNTLTVNLHLMMVSFYRPTKSRYKILIENNTFPSDKYAVDSQAAFHGHDPSEAIVELKPEPGEMTVSKEKVRQTIADLGDSLALVMLGNCNYLSGQRFDFEEVVKQAHSVGALCGFNLAHGAGNLLLSLHDWNVDFAVWCSYKYLNSGPGSLAGAFVHEKHHQEDLHRFAGWWGHDKESRFKMGPNFQPIQSVEAWQLSNPPIFQLAALKSSLDVFVKASMPEIVKKGKKLTLYLQDQLESQLGEDIEVITPKEDRGSMLCCRFKRDPKNLMEQMTKAGAIVDFREPDILRITPAPLYTSYEEVFNLVQLMKECLGGK